MSVPMSVAEKNGLMRVLQMLIEQLDHAGVLPANSFAAEREKEASGIQSAWAGAYAPGTPRDDVRFLRALALSIKTGIPMGVQYGLGVGVDAGQPANTDE